MTEAADLAAANIGGTLLDALLDEIKALQDPYQKLPTAARQELIDRLSRRVDTAVRTAMRTLVQQEYPALPAELGNVVFTAKGIKANVLVARNSEARHELAEHAVAGANVIVILADPEEYLEGLEAQRILPLGIPENVDPETGEVVEEAQSAPSTSLVDRLAALDVPIDGDDPFWTEAQPSELAKLMDWVKAREAGEKIDPPAVLVDRIKTVVAASLAESMAWLEDADEGTRELVEGLTANGVPIETLTEEAVTGWSEDQVGDLWDWIEVAEHEGELTDKKSDTIAGFERAVKLLADAAMLAEPIESPATEAGDDDLPAGGDVFAPEYVRAELTGVGIHVPATEIEKWSREEIEGVHAYIDEYSAQSGPAIVPEVIEPFLVLSLQAGAQAADDWTALAGNPQKLGERLVAYKIAVPAGVVYGWTNDQRMEVAAYMRTVIKAHAADDVSMVGEMPDVLRPYLAPTETKPDPAKTNGASAETATAQADTIQLADAGTMPMPELREFAAGYNVSARSRKELTEKLKAAGAIEGFEAQP